MFHQRRAEFLDCISNYSLLQNDSAFASYLLQTQPNSF